MNIYLRDGQIGYRQIDCPYCHQPMREWYTSVDKLGFVCHSCPKLFSIYVNITQGISQAQIISSEYWLDEYDTPGRRQLRVYYQNETVELHKENTEGHMRLVMKIKHAPLNLNPENVQELWDRLMSINAFY